MVFNDDNTQRTAFTDDSAMADGDSKLPRSSATASGKAEPTKTGTGKTSAAPAGAQVDKLKKQLESLKQQQSVWSNSAKNYEEKLANETSDFRRQVDEEAMQNDKQNVQSYQQKINQVETELSKAQEPSHPAGHDQADNGSSGGHASQP
jgi:predicted RNase H-like nuclease (RuvC/YqgF family)